MKYSPIDRWEFSFPQHQKFPPVQSIFLIIGQKDNKFKKRMSKAFSAWLMVSLFLWSFLCFLFIPQSSPFYDFFKYIISSILSAIFIIRQRRHTIHSLQPKNSLISSSTSNRFVPTYTMQQSSQSQSKINKEWSLQNRHNAVAHFILTVEKTHINRTATNASSSSLLTHP